MRSTRNTFSGLTLSLDLLSFTVALLLLHLSAYVQAQPANDHLASATLLSGTDINFSMSFENATRDGIPYPFPGEYSDVWFSWTAPANGHFLLHAYANHQTHASPFTLVYAGSDPATWTLKSQTHGSLDIFQAQAGVTYTIRFANYRSFTNYDNARLFFTPPALNDLFEDRLLLQGDNFQLSVWSPSAQYDPAEPIAASNGSSPVTWYKWIAPANGAISFEGVTVFTGSDLTELSRFTGNEVFAGQEIQLAVNWSYNYPKEISLSLTRYLEFEGIDPGASYPHTSPPTLRWKSLPEYAAITNLTVYLNNSFFLQTNRLAPIQFPILHPTEHTLTATANASDGKNYALRPLTFRITHPNSTFTDRLPLAGDNTVFEADFRGNPSAIWWSWTAPRSGVLAFDDLDQTYLKFFLFSGTNESDLTRHPTHAAQEGQTYAIAAGFSDGISRSVFGRYRLVLIPTPPPNDNFADAQLISSNHFAAWVCDACATVEPAEPPTYQPGAKTLWFKFIAPANGLADFSAWWHSVFSGDQLHSLQPVTNSSSLTQRYFAAGQTYYIRLESDTEFVRPGKFIFQFREQPTNDAFAAASILQGDHLQFFADTAAATSELGEPDDFRRPRSLWWKFTPATTGYAALRIPVHPQWPNNIFPPHPRLPVRSIFTGDSLTNLSAAPTNSLLDDVTLFPVEAGQSYFICISEFGHAFLTDPFHIFIDVAQLAITSPIHQSVFSMPDFPEFRFSGPLLTNPTTRIEIIEQISYTISPVGFLWNTRSHGIANSPNFTLAGSNFSPSTHRVFAKATTADGQIAYSPPVDFRLLYSSTSPRLIITQNPNNIFVESRQRDDQTVLLESTTDLTNWTQQATFFSNSFTRSTLLQKSTPLILRTRVAP